MLRKIISYSIISLVAFSSHAELIQGDWKSTDDRLSFADTQTGIEWLSLTQTDGKSLQYVMDRLGQGQEFEGWRLPSKSEVSTLYTLNLTQWNVNYSNEYYYKDTISSYNAKSDPEFQVMQSLFGNTYYRDEPGVGVYYQYSWGYSIDDVTGKSFLSGLRYDANGNTSSYREVRLNSNNITYTSTNSGVGIFLVSDGGTTLASNLNPSLNVRNPNAPINNVPVESVFLLSMLGLISFHRLRSS